MPQRLYRRSRRLAFLCGLRRGRRTSQGTESNTAAIRNNPNGITRWHRHSRPSSSSFQGAAKNRPSSQGWSISRPSCYHGTGRADDGSALQIGRLLIDSGYVPEIVHSVIRKLNQTVIAMPSKGQGITAGNKPMSEYERRPGDVQGHYYRIPAAHGRELRIVNIDTNYWKTLFQGRLAIPLGDRGCFSLYGNDRTDHQLVADHLSAEYRVQTQGRGRTVWEWKVRPGASDNHLLDCFVGCAVGASMLGCTLPGSTAAPAREGAPLRLSDLQKQRRGQG